MNHAVQTESQGLGREGSREVFTISPAAREESSVLPSAMEFSAELKARLRSENYIPPCVIKDGKRSRLDTEQCGQSSERSV